MNSKKKRLLQLLNKGSIYAITSPRKDVDYITQVKAALSGNVDIVQFRDKNLNDKDFEKIAGQLKVLLDKKNVPFIINDRIEIAVRIHAEGFHIGDNEYEFDYAKKIAQKYDLVLGISSHSINEAIIKERFADYLGFGPIFDTPNKKNHALLGTEKITKLKKAIKKPFVAIGGIDEENLNDVLNAGARNVAFIRALCGSEDIKKGTEILKNMLKQFLNKK
ncbi:MAG: thiamine phosphate synthase [bacterium]